MWLLRCTKVFAEVEFKYTIPEIPEQDTTAGTVVIPADGADPIEIDLSKIPTIQGTPTAEPGQTADSPDSTDGGTDDLPPNTDPADPPQD